MSDYTEHLISQPGGDGDDDGLALARAIRTRRRRKCIAAGDHKQPGPPDTAKCPRCGL